ncbi:MAG TPA: ATP-dependent zinc metalloprotease FtsH [Smithella sp.]|nr:ATP-dependent zinc metalloprotease FtsH [Syntrophaceae bacterium]MDM7987129.1 ATP-dependent zinc metalloprotease FtsH [Smithella sp.]HNY50542.1 ATP-dependent zinc metalloprotease FtsH [Smithella sp.]HOG90264.1 ATP-dependent zinc metalloprotease FtsH [Smithella sp.]HOU51055.1 ATP-dependent zinc metalloprotease FtsH [Smithella sp.]
MNQFQKNIALVLTVLLVFLLVWQLYNQPKTGTKDIIYSEMVAHLEKGEISEVTVQGDNISGKLTNGNLFKTYAPKDDKLVAQLREKGVKITAKPDEESPWLTILISWAPMILLIGIWIFFMRQMQAGGGKAMAFGKSKARLITDKSKRVTFADVAGIDEAKSELEEVIDFLKDPKKYTKLGGRIPKGLLLVGPPGTGKTLLARAIAGEAEVPFLTISGSDFVEMFVGVGASRVRDLFSQAKKNAPCIIFIDEIDAVGRHRGAGLGGGHDEREQTLNQLLVEMDGFESNEGVILISATNRPDVLDPALLRPGRFDRQVVVPLPDVKGREKIFEVHARKTPIAEDVNFAVLARGTPGTSGADIENLINEAVLNAARSNKDKVNMSDFEFAKDKILMGAERKTMVISDEEKKNTSYHEIGHALVARMLPGTDPIHKVTIIPRGRALGLTQQLPIDEKHTYPKKYLENSISILLGGRAAEELVLHDFTTGAGNDIERATNLARKMVCEWGMSEKMGPLSYGKKEEQIFLGREFATHKDYSEDTAKNIDGEIVAIVSRNYERSKKILTDHMDILHRLSGELLEKEVLSGHEIDILIGDALPKDKHDESHAIA